MTRFASEQLSCHKAPTRSASLPGLRHFACQPPITILGVPLDNVTAQQAMESIARMVESGEPHYLVTANVDFLVQARKDVELRRILLEAHLVLCDGTPLIWASRWLGNPLPERVAGSDLTPRLIELAERKRFRLFFLGASPESASQAISNLKQRHPDLLVAGCYSPPFRSLLEMDHEEIKSRIRDARPDMLFVSLGCPKQEKWIAMHYQQLGVPVCIGVGATIDFLAGQVPRAPVWMQRSGLEWVFRLVQEPRRLFRRYLTGLWVFGSNLVAQWWRLRFVIQRRHKIEPRTPVLLDPACQCFKPPDYLDALAARSYAGLPAEAAADGRHCLLDAADIRFIDSTGIGLLIRLQSELRAAGAFLVLLAPSPAIRRALGFMRLEPFFLTAPDAAAARQLLDTIEMQPPVHVPPQDSADPLRWQGEITAANAEEVWSQTSAYLARRATTGAAAVDLSAVRFLDSSGLELMILARKTAAAHGTELRFTTVPATVRNVIHVARLDDFILEDKTS